MSPLNVRSVTQEVSPAELAKLELNKDDHGTHAEVDRGDQETQPYIENSK